MGLVVFGHVSSLHAQTPEARQRALVLFQRGNDAFAQGNQFEAYDAYVRAFSLSPSFDIACNLGRTEAEMGKLIDGAQHLRYCLKNFPASGRADMRQAEARFQELLRKVTGQVGQLRVAVEPAGTLVSVNGEELGTSPFAEPIFLMPGKVKLVLTKAGYVDETFTFVVQAGTQQDMNIRLTSKPESGPSRVPALSARLSQPRDEAPSPAPPVPVARSAGDGHSPLRTALLVGGASATLVGLGLGTYFSLQAADDHSAFRATRTAITAESGELGCQPGAVTPSCERLDAQRRNAAEKERLGFVSYAGATGVGLATFAVWLLWKPDQPSVSVTVGGNFSRGNVVLRGVF